MQKFSFRSLLNALPWVITVIAITLLAFRHDSSAQRPATVNPGRYQLLVADGKSNEARDIFKIDTETGITWVYRQVLIPNEKEPVAAWVVVLELKRQ